MRTSKTMETTASQLAGPSAAIRSTAARSTRGAFSADSFSTNQVGTRLTELYTIKIAIAPVTRARWKSICRDCAGTVDSLVELLQGRLAKGVMDRVCRKGDGLFPSPDDIELSCSCPDWADMCKHVAAALYSIGARLDEKPQLLFVLRGVDENELLAFAEQDGALNKAAPAAGKVLNDSDVAALFGLDIAETANSNDRISAAPKLPQRSKPLKGSKALPEAKPETAKIRKSQPAMRTTSEPKIGSPSSGPEKACTASTSNSATRYDKVVFYCLPWGEDTLTAECQCLSALGTYLEPSISSTPAAQANIRPFCASNQARVFCLQPTASSCGTSRSFESGASMANR
jgi:uncharacterized Zn finger protein